MPAGGPLSRRRAAGRLRARVQFRSPVRIEGETGQHKVTSWTNQGDPVWAEIEELLLTAGERTRHEQQVPGATHIVCIRGQLAVLHDWSILWGSRVLNIKRIAGGGSGIANEIVIWCEELPASTQSP